MYSTQNISSEQLWFSQVSDPQPDMAWDLSQAAICVQIVGVHVSCSSHYCTQLAAFFIDPRAEWSTTRGIKISRLFFKLYCGFQVLIYSAFPPPKGQERLTFATSLNILYQIEQAIDGSTPRATRTHWGEPFCFCFGNDPSAGSPTETLLRLLLPLSDQVWPFFRHSETTRKPSRRSVQGPH